MIQVYHVYKSYPGTPPILTDLSFRVKKGGMVFLTGPSGAGKTTLFRLLFCGETADQGQLILAGRNLLKISNAEKRNIRRSMGIVFQDFKLLLSRSAYENIAFAQRVIGVPAPLIKKRVHHVLKLVGLRDKKDLLVERLSGGEQQRIAIARALVNNPLILLADEPTGNLDDELAEQIMNLFYAANERGATVIIATHNKKIISKDSNILFLNNGKIVNQTSQD